MALPFVPFARGASEEGVRASFARLSKANVAARDDMLVALAVNSTRIFPGSDWGARIPKEIRMKSSFYDQILAEGALEAKRATVTRWVRARVGPRNAAPLTASLRDADDARLDRVTELLESKKDDDALLAALRKLLPARSRARRS